MGPGGSLHPGEDEHEKSLDCALVPPGKEQTTPDTVHLWTAAGVGGSPWSGCRYPPSSSSTGILSTLREGLRDAGGDRPTEHGLHCAVKTGRWESRLLWSSESSARIVLSGSPSHTDGRTEVGGSGAGGGGSLQASTQTHDAQIACQRTQRALRWSADKPEDPMAVTRPPSDVGNLDTRQAPFTVGSGAFFTFLPQMRRKIPR